MPHGRATVVELVYHAPGAFARTVGPAQVRVAQAVFAQVPPRTAQHHHPGAAAGKFGIQRGGGLLRQLHATLDELRRGLVRLTRAGHGAGAAASATAAARKNRQRSAPPRVWIQHGAAPLKSLVVQQGLAQRIGDKGQHLARDRQHGTRADHAASHHRANTMGRCDRTAPPRLRH